MVNEQMYHGQLLKEIWIYELWWLQHMCASNSEYPELFLIMQHHFIVFCQMTPKKQLLCIFNWLKLSETLSPAFFPVAARPFLFQQNNKKKSSMVRFVQEQQEKKSLLI